MRKAHHTARRCLGLLIAVLLCLPAMAGLAAEESTITLASPGGEGRLLVRRTVIPGEDAPYGSQVEVSYHLQNIGDVMLRDIMIVDPDIHEAPVMLADIDAGLTSYVAISFRLEGMRVLHPTISFLAEEKGGLSQRVEAVMGGLLLDPAQPDVIVTATARQIVNPGDKVDLTFSIANGSDKTFENIRVVDGMLGDLDSGLLLGPHKTYQGTVTITVNQSSVFQPTVTARDAATGDEYIFTANEVTVQTTDSITDPMPPPPPTPGPIPAEELPPPPAPSLRREAKLRTVVLMGVSLAAAFGAVVSPGE